MLNGILFACKCKYKNANVHLVHFEYTTKVTASHFSHLFIFHWAGHSHKCNLSFNVRQAWTALPPHSSKAPGLILSMGYCLCLFSVWVSYMCFSFPKNIPVAELATWIYPSVQMSVSVSHGDLWCTGIPSSCVTSVSRSMNQDKVVT